MTYPRTEENTCFSKQIEGEGGREGRWLCRKAVLDKGCVGAFDYDFNTSTTTSTFTKFQMLKIKHQYLAYVVCVGRGDGKVIPLD